jgi:antitoxin VapB
MALSIKTAEADELARSLATLTGESVTEAAANLPARLTVLSRALRASYDTRPVKREAWDAATGDEA